MIKNHKQSLSIIGRRLLAGIMIFTICLGSIAPRLNTVEIKALFITADVFKQQPFLKHYFDILKFSEYLVTSFYIGQSLAKGETPRPVRKSVPKKQSQSNDWALISNLMFDKPKFEYNLESKLAGLGNIKADYAYYMQYNLSLYQKLLDFQMMYMTLNTIFLCALYYVLILRKKSTDYFININNS